MGDAYSGPKSNTLKDEVQQNGSGLEQVWLSFNGMLWHLLNIISATRAGNKSIHLIHPFIFAYNHFNYSKYMTAMLSEILNLEQNHPEIYQEFLAENLSIQMSQVFSRIERDKIIKTTINRDQNRLL